MNLHVQVAFLHHQTGPGFGHQLVFRNHAVTVFNQAQKQIKGACSQCDSCAVGVNQTLVRENFEVGNLVALEHFVIVHAFCGLNLRHQGCSFLR